MFVPTSTYAPSTYPGSYPQVPLPGTPRPPTRTTVLAGWSRCFLKLRLFFCPRSSSFSSSLLCQKYENLKAGGLGTCSPHRRCLHHWHPETGGYSLRAQWKLLVNFLKIFEHSRTPMWPLACYPLTHSSTPPSLGMYLPTAGISKLFYIPKYLHFPYVLFFLSVLWDFQSWSLFGTIYSISLRIFLTTVLSSVYCI